MRRTALVLAVGLLLTIASAAWAHPGDHPAGMRLWKAADEAEFEAAFVAAKDGEVRLWKHDGSRVWLPLERLSRFDQQWVRERQDEILVINHATEPQPTARDEPRPHSYALFAVPSIALLAMLTLTLTRVRLAAVAVLFGVVVFASMGCGGGEQEIDVSEVESREETPAPAIKKHFEPFAKKLTFRWDDEYLYVGSDGLPDHQMMVGIKAWQQQVPLPQPYVGKNAWQIPLEPKPAKKPISCKKALYRGAIALAVNGVPIFNALNNRGEDAYLAGELDEFGGHCGRGDDYHYHVAPVCLEKVAGKGKPIAYALDGYPLYGYLDGDGKEPDDLDEYNGRTEKDGYRYYSTKKYPYVNGGMRGEVTVRNDQIEPQPRDAPVRPAGKPLRGAKITDFERDVAKKTATLKYELNGKTHSVSYVENKDGSFTFTYADGEGKERTQTYKRRLKGKKE